MSSKKHYRVYLPRIIGGLILIVIIALVVNWIKGFVDKPVEKKKRIQKITILKPPPPPPPPPKIEKPPEPEIEEKIEEPEPEPEPENLPDVSDEPPAADLGLDADGSAGSDAFGLVGRKGGRGLLSGNPNSWYAGLVKNNLIEALSDRDVLRRKAYRATVHFWFEIDGTIKRYKLVNGSGDSNIDSTINSVLAQMNSIDEAPPPGMGQPLKLRISVRM